RPDLANPAVPEPVRQMVDEVDAQRNVAGRPQPRPDAQVDAEVQRRVESDYAGERARIMAKTRSGQLLDDTETLIAKIIVSREGLAAIQSGDSQRIREAMSFIDAYRESGAAAARAFRQRYDPV